MPQLEDYLLSKDISKVEGYVLEPWGLGWAYGLHLRQYENIKLRKLFVSEMERL